MDNISHIVSLQGEIQKVLLYPATRLIVAALLGGIIGLERGLKQKPAGLRTNMFICLGAAMFTVLSDRLAAQSIGDHTRIAAQIVPGIGFIGAGSILHSRTSITGLTTAATLFVVASIGMATGGAQYWEALVATVVLLLALHVLGWLEARFNLKPVLMDYELVADKAEEAMAEINQVLEEERHEMNSVRVGRTNGRFRLQFVVGGTLSEHSTLMKRFRESESLRTIQCIRCPNEE